MFKRAFFLSVLALFLGQSPGRAELTKLTIRPCNGSTIFLELAGLEPAGEPWPGPPETFSIAILQLSVPDVSNPEGNLKELGRTAGELVSFEGRALLRARFAAPIPREAELRVVVRNQDETALAGGDFSTKSGGTVKHDRLDPSATTFDVDSRTPLATAGALEMAVIDPARAASTNRSALPVRPLLDPQCDMPDARFGIAVKLAAGKAIPFGSGLELKGLRDVYGSAINLTGRLAPPLIPRGREDSGYFLRFLFESAAGSADALSVDLKAQPAVQLRGDWLFRPELTAFVSRHLPGATNSIRAASLFTRTSLARRGALVSSTLSLGPALEADRDFDRVNGMIDLRWLPGFANLYHPREKTALVTNRRPEEISFAWILEGRIGLEAGRSLSRQTVGAVEIDRYDILRLRPVIHGNWEYGRFNLDLSSNLRYLFTEELTVQRNSPRKVNGSRPFTEATFGYFLDRERHLSFAATYKKGSEPPLFVAIERFSLGLVAKY